MGASVNGPYASAAGTYWNAGWRGVLPLPPRAKKLPPRGYTGEDGVDPSYPDIHAWAQGPEGSGNIALRLPRNIIGLDVDNYGDKPGAKTLHDAEKRWGALPPTWRTTSRDDGISGIRLFRVPEGLAWPGELGSATEIIQYRHRYAVVWPSIHPEGRTYRWITADGVTSASVPDPDQLPTLPGTWIEGLTGGELATSTARNAFTSAQTSQWLVLRPGSSEPPCARMKRAITQTLDDLRTGSAHCAARDGALRAIRLADEGHSGLAIALSQVRQAFVAEATSPARDALNKHRRSVGEAEREWSDLVTSATNLVTANPTGTITCDCAGQLTGLVTGNTAVTDGSSALALAPEPDQAQDEEHTSWWPKDLTAVIAGHGDEPPPAILSRGDGVCLFYRSKVNGIIGESESGKTWIAILAVAQTLAAGGTVTYLDFEDTAHGIVSRLNALDVHDLTGFHYIGPDETLHAKASDDLRQSLDLTRPDLIVLDGFNAAMTLLGLDLGDNGDATKFSQILLRPLSSSGAAVVYVDHIPKNKDNRGKGGIGAQAKRAMTTGCALAVDVLVPFGRGMTGKLAITVDKDRPGHVRAEAADAKRVGTAVLTSHKDSGRVEVVIEPPTMTSRHERRDGELAVVMELVSDFLLSSPERSSLRAIRAGVQGNNTSVDQALAALIDGGFVVQEPGHKHRVERRFTVAGSLETGPVPTVLHRAANVPAAHLVEPADTRADRAPPYRGTGTVAATPAGHVDTTTGEILGARS